MTWHTDPIQRQNNPDNNIGVRIEMDDLIVKDNEGSAQQYIPQNGEYELGGRSGDGYYCINCEPLKMDGMGCEGFFRHCAGGGGQHPGYHRTSYNANKTACCTNGGPSTIGNVTCDPKYHNGGATRECDDVYADKCIGNTLESKDCVSYCSRNTGLCNPRIRDYCNTGNNMNSTYCREKAKSIGGMDTGVTNWCASNKNDPFCSCYSAVNKASSEIVDPEARALFARPECYITKCSSGTAYQYDNMKSNKGCPPVNYCKNTLNVLGSNDVNLANVTQKCDQAITQNSSGPVIGKIPQATVTTTETTQDMREQAQKFIDNNKYLIIFIVILLIVLGLGALLLSSSSTPVVDTSDKHFLDLIAEYSKHDAPKEKMPDTLPSADSSTTLNEL